MLKETTADFDWFKLFSNPRLTVYNLAVIPTLPRHTNGTTLQILRWPIHGISWLDTSSDCTLIGVGFFFRWIRYWMVAWLRW